MQIHELLREGILALQETAATPNLDAELLLCHSLGVTRVTLICNKFDVVDPKQIDGYRAVIKRRSLGEPVQYITHQQEFMGLDFYVDSRVLIPRPDTEVLVETVIEALQSTANPAILEIGSGSGAIPVSLASFIKTAKLISIDISADALMVAQKNATANGVDDRVTFIQGDLLEPVDTEAYHGQFDAVVSNPPYIPAEDIDGLQVEVAVHEPRLA